MMHTTTIQLYTYQLLQALVRLHEPPVSVLHADFKPDNILVTQNECKVKLADLGSAAYTHETEVTPYLVSRFYRAPEISIFGV